MSHKCLSVLSKQSENESRVRVEWYAGNSMKANAEKFQGVTLTGSRHDTDVWVSLGDTDIAFVQKWMSLACVLTMNLTLKNMSSAFFKS